SQPIHDSTDDGGSLSVHHRHYGSTPHEEAGVRGSLFITGSPARPHTEGATAIGAAFASLENLARHLAIELSPAGIRPVCLRSSAMPDTKTIQDVTRNIAVAMSLSEVEASQFLASSTMLHVSPTTADTAKVAAFLASDSARTITGTQVMSEIR